MGNKSENQLYIGIDGGGSKSRARLYSKANGVLGAGLSGPANAFQDLDGAIRSIKDATHKALEAADLPRSELKNIITGIGIAGANLPNTRTALQNWRHPYQDLHVTTDLHIACLGAHHGGNGAVIIAGTGSAGISYVDGTLYVIGGHGFPFGDKCSGAWMGLQALKHTLLALDGFEPQSALVSNMLEKLQLTDAVAIVEKMSGATSTKFAQFAPCVFEAAKAQDDVAVRIIREGAAYLSQMGRRLLDNHPPRLSFIGGLAPYIAPWLDKDVAEALAAPYDPPEGGAIIFAERELKPEPIMVAGSS